MQLHKEQTHKIILFILFHFIYLLSFSNLFILSKVGYLSQEQPEGSLFDSYYTEV